MNTDLEERIKALEQENAELRRTFGSNPLFSEVRADERERLFREMLGELPHDAYTAMLTAVGEIPLEQENGGLEYPPFKVFKAMLRAYAQTRGIAV